MKLNLTPIAAAATLALAATYPLAASAGQWVGDHDTAKLPHISQAAAKSRITNDNYTNITNMQRTPNGWTANADQQGQPVKLSVSNLGVVHTG